MKRALNSTALAARNMDNGRMLDTTLAFWKGRSFAPMPGDDEKALRYKSERQMALARDLASALVPAENMIKGVVDNAADYVLASEPSWNLTTEKAAEVKAVEALLTAAWNKRRLHEVCRLALRSRIRDGEGAIRVRIPKGAVALAQAGGGGDPVTTGRDWLRFEALDMPERLTIWEDEDRLTLRAECELGSDKDGNPLGKEVAFVDAQGFTVVLLEKDDKKSIIWRLPLGGRLPYVQVKGKALVTQGMIDNQAGANLIMTSAMSNSELAGQIMEHFHNMQPQRGPDRVVSRRNAETGELEEVVVPGDVLPAMKGPGGELYTADTIATQFVEDDKGEREVPVVLKGSYERHGPVSSEPLAFTLDRCEYNIYAEAKQRHYLMQDKATATGEARKTAMSAFFKSLAPYRVDAVSLLRDLLDTTVALSYALCRQPLPDINIEPQLTDTLAEPTVEERAQDDKEYEAGKISRERWRARGGVLNSEAEDKQREKEAVAEAKWKKAVDDQVAKISPPQPAPVPAPIGGNQ